ncbi:hypothetical protein GCM10010510_36040 [Streptomyces anandii JCM 4720]|nr:hypothetical protein GCM10010510_36040 [Streptomyces anandii JCM 4720]
MLTGVPLGVRTGQAAGPARGAAPAAGAAGQAEAALFHGRGAVFLLLRHGEDATHTG